MEDQRIIELYWLRSEDTISETASKYGQYLQSISLHILLNVQDAEECVNDTYMNKKEYSTYYYWGENYSAVQVYLKNRSSMWFILPDEGKTVDDVLSGGEYTQMISLQGNFVGENAGQSLGSQI